MSRYRDARMSTGLEFKLWGTQLVGVGEGSPHLEYGDIPLSIRERAISHIQAGVIRPHLARSLKAISDEDLSIAGIFVVARKASST